MKVTTIFGHSGPLSAAPFAVVIALATTLGMAATDMVSAQENNDTMLLENEAEPLIADTDLISDWPEIPDHIFRPREPGEEEEDMGEDSDEETQTDTEWEDETMPEPEIEKPEGQDPARDEGSLKTVPETTLEGELSDGTEGAEGIEGIIEQAEDMGKGFLLDQNWNEVKFPDLEGKIVLVTFFYSECKYSHCNYLNNKMKFISRKFVEELGQDLVLVSITFDPAIDTVENLKIYSAKWEPDPSRWAFLTGDEADIVRVAKRFGIIFRWDDGDQSYNHSVRTFLVDREGEIVRKYRGMYYKHRGAIKDIKNLLQGKTLPPQEDLLVPTESGIEKEEETEDEAVKKKEPARKKR